MYDMNAGTIELRRLDYDIRHRPEKNPRRRPARTPRRTAGIWKVE